MDNLIVNMGGRIALIQMLFVCIPQEKIWVKFDFSHNNRLIIEFSLK